MAKAQITIPLDIPDVRVLQSTLGNMVRSSSRLKVQRKGRLVANADDGSQNCMDAMSG